MRFSSLAYIASVITIALGSTVQDVLNDLANLQASVTTLDNDINAFPDTGGDLLQALDIHTDATNAESVIETATTDAQNVTPSPLSEADGQSVLDAVNSVVPLIEDALTVIVQKKPAFDALPLGGIPALVAQDLSDLNTATNALANALIAIAPADLADQSNTLIAEVDAAFATAIAAYSDS